MSVDSALLPFAVVLPITSAALAPLLGRVSKRLPLVVGLVAMTATAMLLVALAPSVLEGRVLVHHVGNWAPVDGTQLGVTFAADAFGLVFALLCALLGALLLLHTLSELGELGARELAGYACLFQLLLAALIGSALTADILNLFVWFEVAALASYGLTGFFLERPPAVEAAFKTMVLTNMAAFYVFVAVGIVYAGHGALNFGQVSASMSEGAQVADLVALGLVVAGFGTKAGLVPFHGWLADAHTAAPGPVSALFSGLMVNLGLLGMLRFVFDVYGGRQQVVLSLLVVLGGVGAVGGALVALAQDDLKRLLAYDTVSQMGVLVVAAGVGTAESFGGMVYHLVDHALFKTLLFLCAGVIVHATGMTKLSQMGGLARHRPVVTGAFVVGVLAIAGVPPLNGYVSLGLIHHALESGGHLAALVTLTVAQVLTVAALARATYLAFFRRREDEYDRMERPRPGMVVSFGLLTAGCVALGCVPFWFLHHVADPAAATLVDPHLYAQAAMSHSSGFSVEPTKLEVFHSSHLALTALTIVLGVIVAWWYVRRESEPRPIGWLRRLHNGSVNEYASWSVLGLVMLVAVLGL